MLERWHRSIVFLMLSSIGLWDPKRVVLPSFHALDENVPIMKGTVLMRVQINLSVWNVTLRIVKQEKLHASSVLGVD